MDINLSHHKLESAGHKGAEEFVTLIKNAIVKAAGGELNANSISILSTEQITLWAYFILRDEVMDGGFIQLIYNGYGQFFFRNPFARAIEEWGLIDLAPIIRKAHRLYDKFRTKLEIECSDEDFMALFEQYPEFDALDDAFVENEEKWTLQIAHYVDENLERFVQID